MPEAQIRYGFGNAEIPVRFSGRGKTFNLATERLSAAALAPVDSLCEDLLEIASVVFVADGSVPRGGETRADMASGWRRDFRIRIPVRDPGFWTRPDVGAALTEAVSFLTDDRFHFDFVPGEFPPEAEPYLRFDPNEAAFAADEAIMFSGGLDSFAGALEVLATTTTRVLLVSHRSAQKVIGRQEALGNYLSERFPGRVKHLHVTARRQGPEAKDTTQRSRTLLFAALGRAAAQTLGVRKLSFYENGVVSHNLPISPQVIGTMATRTTHPLALHLLNRLLDLIGPDALRIENRYQWLTKTDVVRRIEQYGALEMIERAVSCTSVRDQDSLHTHCGTCSQCLDRRFAILSANLERHDPESRYATDVLFGDRSSDRSMTMAMEWARHALRLKGLNERGVLNEFGLEFSRIRRGHPDLPDAEVLRRTLDMHRRHSESVTQALEAAIREKASDLVAGRLPKSSLVSLHLSASSGSSPALAPDPRPGSPSSRTAPDVAEEDVIPNPDSPLTASFFGENGKPHVEIHGLGSVSGSPALVAHALRPSFDEARGRALAPEEHPFVQPAQDLQMSKPTVRQNVSRCRQTLAEFYKAIHGKLPTRDLLIESRPPKGYRLEPDLRIGPKDRIDFSR